MALMLTIEEFNSRLEKLSGAMIRMERSRIREMLQDYADAAFGDGEFTTGNRILAIISALDTVAPITETSVVTTVEGPGDPVLSEALGGELPPVILRTDEEDIENLLHHPHRPVRLERR